MIIFFLLRPILKHLNSHQDTLTAAQENGLKTRHPAVLPGL